MPVDWARRDELASILADYLRGDQDTVATLERLESLKNKNDRPDLPAAECDETVERIRDVTAYGLEWQQNYRTQGMPEWYWQECRRELAFLTTALEEGLLPLQGDDDWDRMVRFARWQILFLLLALGLSPVVGWWFLAVALVVSFAWFQRVAGESDRARNAAVKKRRDCRPFATLEEWHAHENRLDRFALPLYEASVHAQSKSTILHHLGWVLQVVLIVGVVGFMIAWSLIFWPLWLVMVSCCKPSWLKEHAATEASVSSPKKC